jgi:hypothetical protein
MTQRFPFIFLTAALLTGCATLSEDECLAGNWQTIGFEDGVQGYFTQRIGLHREACAEYGVAPDMDAYLLGHRQGVEQFCTRRKGLELGAAGKAYNGVCPDDLAGRFLDGYQEGKRIYQVSSQLDNVTQGCNALSGEIEELETELQSKREMIISQSTGEVLRRELMPQIKVLEESISAKRALLEEREQRREQLERSYQYVREKAGLI